MTTEQFKGQVREFFNVAGAAFAAWGFATGNQMEAVSGVITSGLMLAWGFKAKEPAEVLMSLVRKVAGAVGAVMVTFEVMEPNKAASLVAVVGPLFAMVTSHWHHGGKFKTGGGVNLFLICAACVFFLPACTNTGITATLSSQFGSLTYDREDNTLETQVNADAIVEYLITPEK